MDGNAGAATIRFFHAAALFKPSHRHHPGVFRASLDATTRRIFSGFTIVAIVFIDAAGALYAGGLVLQMLFPFFALWQAVAIMGLVAGVYTIWGGLSAVVVTDSVQAVLLIIAGVIVTVIGFQEIGGWDALWSQLPDTHTTLLKPADDDFLPWHGIGGVVLLGFYYWTLNQFIAQRTLGARSLKDGQQGALFAGGLKLGNLLIMIVPGLIGLALYPELQSADRIFPTMVNDLLPVGLKGIVLAGLVAAIMSSLDSALNAGASLITLDFIKPYKPDAGPELFIRIGKVITGLLMLIAILYAPQIAHFETLFGYVQSALAYVVPAIVAVYFAGLFMARTPAVAARHVLRWGLLFGAGLFVLREFTPLWSDAGLPAIHYTAMAVVLFAAYVLMLWGWSRCIVQPLTKATL